KWHTNRWKAYLKYKKFNPLALPLSILGTAAIIPMVLKLNQLYKYFFPVMEKLKSLSRPLFAVNSHFDIILLLLTVCITPAVCEEALFRGYFQRTLERRWKIFIAIPVSGLLFALFHKSPLGLPVLTVVGIYLGLLFYAFDSLWISMFTHLLYNALIIAVTNIPAAQMPLVFNSSGSVKNTVFISSVVTFLLITVLIIILFPGKRHRKSYIKQE
ncbi:MAG TPA: CPBP family intramembrane glutamic endopeptidase, partial [Spirochaetota bacterium]|nr:CPBP family intramembrane glutamic endopeptidase [Spirochaetota bacterium]